MTLQPRLGEEAPWLTWTDHLTSLGDSSPAKDETKKLGKKKLEMPRIEASKPDPTGHQ